MPAPQEPPDAPAESHHAHFSGLFIGALGVVFGDIGTSPLYAFRQCLLMPRALPLDRFHLFGISSLIFWTMAVIVSLKYVLIVLRADNEGEGGTMALLALLSRKASSGAAWVRLVTILAVAATALFYGDAVITPAISVLSAVEGLKAVDAGIAPLVLPITIAILVALFVIQARGTERVGSLFGPVMLVYFACIALLGLRWIVLSPEVLRSLAPVYAMRFVAAAPLVAFGTLGAVVLTVTGAEALYADMGHFGRRPITLAWLAIVWPCLMLNYMGQAALLLHQPGAIAAPFFLMAPGMLRLPLVLLATFASVIASQAVISGAFSVTRQAIQLGFAPRLEVRHTSERTIGQVYLPLINWLLLAAVVLLVYGFRRSDDLAAAYGIAVTGTMLITGAMLGFVTGKLWGWPLVASIGLTGALFTIDALFFGSNAGKIANGGWVPLLIAAIVFVLFRTWSSGRQAVRERLREDALPLGVFLGSATVNVARVPGTAVYLTPLAEAVPRALLHNLKHNRVLHERVLLVTLALRRVPHVAPAARGTIQPLARGFNHVVLSYGFADPIDIPADLAALAAQWSPPLGRDVSYFISRQSVLRARGSHLARWQRTLFAWMVRNVNDATGYLRLPPGRVIELGSQIEI